jgi:Domain of unknown function (DUF4166)
MNMHLQTSVAAPHGFSLYRNIRNYRRAVEQNDGSIVSDPRFRALLGEAGWAALPTAVRARFGRKARGGQAISYAGHVTLCEMSRTGWLLAQAARLVGAPLPLRRDTGVPAVVTVTEDEAGGGQFWMRQYGAHKGFPQTIHSVKRFAGPTGVEEYLGLGLGIALCLRVERGVLLFESDHYFLRVGTLRLRIPRWLAPGDLTIGHRDEGGGWFTFTLTLHHRCLGILIRQYCRFTELQRGDLR